MPSFSLTDALHELGPRSLAAVLRAFCLPLEALLKEGEYRPFALGYSRACDAAAPWYGLGHDPSTAPSLELDAVEHRGSREEQQLWSVLWSAARAMERARGGHLDLAYAQFQHTLTILRDWPDALAEVSKALRTQLQEYTAHVAEITAGLGDPPVDPDALAIPAFYVAMPRAPAEETAIDETSGFPFDASAEELIRLIKTGSAAFFCGAGISIASGIPSAHVLREALLAKLPISTQELERLSESGLPFEAFMEVLHHARDLAPLFRLFAATQTSAAHVLLARLAAEGLVRLIATTNFDELIERALTELRCAYITASTPTAASAVVEVLKLHGTVSDPSSIALTMQEVAGHQRVLSREQAIKKVFLDGDHDAVIILGYSCSDLFDINPIIAALGSSMKRTYLIEHTPGTQRAEDIARKVEKNPFRSCKQGIRLFCDTDSLLDQISRAVTGERLPRVHTPPAAHWQRCVDQWSEQFGGRDGTWISHTATGRLWYVDGDYRAAKMHFRAALARARDSSLRCQQLLNVSGCHRALSEYPRALECAKEAYRLAQVMDDDYAEARAAGTIGNALFNMGDFEKAVEWYERDVATLRRLPAHRRELGSSLAGLANTYGAREDFNGALQCFEEGVAIAREFGDKLGEGSRRGGMGQVYRLLGKWSEAEAAHRDAHAIATAMNDRPGIATQLASLAMMESSREHFEEAIGLGQQAAILFAELEDRQGEARVAGNLGSDLLRMGRMTSAIEFFLRSLEIAATIGEQTIVGTALRNVRLILAARQQAPRPFPQLQRAEALLQTIQLGKMPDLTELREVLLDAANLR